MSTDPFACGISHVCGGCKDPKACKVCCCLEHLVCNNKLLMEIAARLPGDWEKLGIYLGVSREERDKIGGEKRNKVEAWALDMFKKWWQDARKESRWSDLQNALTEVHRHDLIQFTKDFFAANHVDPQNPDQHKMDKYFQKMAEQIPRDWKDIGIYLYLSLDDLHAIQMAATSVLPNTKTNDILDAWRKKNTANYTDLISALEEIGRRDIIVYIEEEVKKYRRVCPLPDPRQLEERHREVERQRRLEQQQQLHMERDRQAEVEQRRMAEQQQLQMQPSVYRPPTQNYVPPDVRNINVQPARFVTAPSHEYRPPPTAFNQDASTHSLQQSESVSRNTLISQPTPESSLANPEHLPSPQLQSIDMNSVQSGGSNPSFQNSLQTEETASVAQARQGMDNMHIDSRDGADGNMSANTFATDLTTENIPDNLSLVEVGAEVGNSPNSSQMTGGPSTQVSVSPNDVNLEFGTG